MYLKARFLKGLLTWCAPYHAVVIASGVHPCPDISIIQIHIQWLAWTGRRTSFHTINPSFILSISCRSDSFFRIKGVLALCDPYDSGKPVIQILVRFPCQNTGRRTSFQTNWSVQFSLHFLHISNFSLDTGLLVLYLDELAHPWVASLSWLSWVAVLAKLGTCKHLFMDAFWAHP